ncbi:hypothetical protein LC653_06705 [Nostoc sp. CHAB 5784]|uniref:hypothetical protein n=1 Tax=Nostoc mirabile TaxID=2907820 RepID=UPI001E5DC355|nr:hypothetical protein [Nostoc mirabile]MCC5663624.1 hypothetical protein [Nostoc mirabile CHAB5784]
MSVETMALSADTIELLVETMALSADTIELLVETMALLVDAIALQVDKKPDCNLTFLNYELRITNYELFYKMQASTKDYGA